MRDSLRATAKELIWLTVRHRPGDKAPICLFCTRRGGSTWLMEIIGANRGILPLNQPVEVFTPNLTPYQYKLLPKSFGGHIVHPDPDEERALRAYTDELMAGRIRVNAPHAFWRRGFQLRTDRLLLKITGAKAMMDWFSATYGVDIVYLVRHPIPQSLSCIRNGWGTSTMTYLRNEWFAANVVGDPALRNYAEQVHETGTELERFVVNWAVENLYPLRVLADRPQWLPLSYEECVLDQAHVLDRLRAQLALSDTEAMQRAAQRLSRSSGMSSESAVSAIRAGDRNAQVSAWQDVVSADDVARVGRILDRFGITLYSPTSPLSDWTGYRA